MKKLLILLAIIGLSLTQSAYAFETHSDENYNYSSGTQYLPNEAGGSLKDQMDKIQDKVDILQAGGIDARIVSRTSNKIVIHIENQATLNGQPCIDVDEQTYTFSESSNKTVKIVFSRRETHFDGEYGSPISVSVPPTSYYPSPIVIPNRPTPYNYGYSYQSKGNTIYNIGGQHGYSYQTSKGYTIYHAY